jgi:hypothetical protein
MFALRQTAFFCLFLLGKNTFFSNKTNEIFYEILVLIRLSDGLTCYSCTGCNDPFNANNAQTTTVNASQGYSCSVSEVFFSHYCLNVYYAK